MPNGLLTLVAHRSPHYGSRTFHNASVASLTVAIASNFQTAGERITRKAAGEKYLAIPLGMPAIDAARLLYRAWRDCKGSVLNIAGNSLHSLAKSGCDRSQEAVNAYVCEILRPVHTHCPIAHVVSGGQTGLDQAGLVAAIALGIPATGTLPRGFIQRGIDGRDVSRQRDDLHALMMSQARTIVLRSLV